MRLPFMRSAPLALALSVSFSLGCNYYGDCDHPWDEEPFPPDPCAGGGCVPRDFDAGHTDASHGDGGAAHRCTRDTECGESERCDPSGVCTPRPPGWCADAADCRADEACVAHHCESLDSVCHVDLDCGAGRGCIDNACRPLCVSDTECGAAGICIAGHCNPTLQCDVTHACADGATCVDGACAAACVDSTSCARGEVCTGGLCIPDVAPHPFCASDADCAAGHPCLDGVCRTLCPSGTLDECQRSDAQFVSCTNTGAHLLCLMRSEASPECVTPSDCASGQHCIDALCR